MMVYCSLRWMEWKTRFGGQGQCDGSILKLKTRLLGIISCGMSTSGANLCVLLNKQKYTCKLPEGYSGDAYGKCLNLKNIFMIFFQYFMVVGDSLRDYCNGVLLVQCFSIIRTLSYQNICQDIHEAVTFYYTLFKVSFPITFPARLFILSFILKTPSSIFFCTKILICQNVDLGT